MKIGQFAKKHRVTHDAIRFYIDKGLLVPSKKEGQYYFNEIDSKEIEKIMELKKMNFSLSEIHRILTFQRLGGTSTEFSRNLYRMILEEKQKHVKQELKKWNQIDEHLKKQMEELNTHSQRQKQVLGFPITSTELLVCPVCKNVINLSAGVLEKNMIIQAELDCECGYQGKIKDGIYIDERAVRTKKVNGRPIPSKEEYLMNTNPEHISYLFKGMAKVIEYVLKYQNRPKYIMELSNCVGFFLLQYINYLPKDSVYILIDYDLGRLTQLKFNLERYYSHNKFIFFCCDYADLPMKSSIVDVIIDLFMSNIYEKEQNENLLHIVMPFLKENGLFTVSYPLTRRSTMDGHHLEMAGEEIEDSEMNRIHKRLAFSNLRTLETMEIGSVYLQGNKQIKNGNVREYQYIYAGEKI